MMKISIVQAIRLAVLLSHAPVSLWLADQPASIHILPTLIRQAGRFSARDVENRKFSHCAI